RSSSTSPRATLAPASAISRAVSAPMPRAAPEISATLPSRRFIAVPLKLPARYPPSPAGWFPPSARERARGRGWEAAPLKSGRGVAHEDLRDRLAPGSAGAFAAFQEVGRGAGVEHIGVGPMLVHATPRIGPVIEELAADQGAAEGPHVLIALFLQMLVADHDIVDIGGLVGQMVEAALVAANAE